MILGILPILAFAGLFMVDHVLSINPHGPFFSLLLLLLILVLVPPIPALIMGIVALRRIKKSNGILTGRAYAITGLSTSIVWMILLSLSVVLLPILGTMNREPRHYCSNNLKHLGIICKMFANENSPGANYPMLSPKAGLFMFQAEQVFPEYMTDSLIMRCPKDPAWVAILQANGINPAQKPNSSEPVWHDLLKTIGADTDPKRLINDDSYIYLGYVITSDDEMEAFAEIYKARVAQGLPFDMDLPAPPGRGSMGADTFYRLKEGVERLFITDINDPNASAQIQRAIPVMWDKVLIGPEGPLSNHKPPGGNILYMDGHVECVRYPEKWPITERTTRIITELYSMKRGEP